MNEHLSFINHFQVAKNLVKIHALTADGPTLVSGTEHLVKYVNIMYMYMHHATILDSTSHIKVCL